MHDRINRQYPQAFLEQVEKSHSEISSLQSEFDGRPGAKQEQSLRRFDLDRVHAAHDPHCPSIRGDHARVSCGESPYATSIPNRLRSLFRIYISIQLCRLDFLCGGERSADTHADPKD